MVDQLNSFASEVTRVAREVGTEGKLGGQAEVTGVAGTWKDLTDNVNFMAGNLTAQVRNIAEVTTAVANGDLSQEDHGGREGRDPGAEEHHQHDGGPAQLVRLRSDAAWPAKWAPKASSAARPTCKGVAGTWKDLTDNVNFMAGNLTPGPQHRRRDHRGGQRRPVQEDHGRREGRNSRAEEHHQHDGGPAQLVRLGSDPRGPRSRYRRKTGRPGRGEAASPAPGRI